MQKNNKILLLLLNWLIYLFPLFYILGNFFMNASVVLISITGLVLYREKIFDFKKDNFLILISAFFLIIIICTFFESISNPGNVKVYKSIIFLRYFILLLVVRYALINDHINLKKFLVSCLIFSTLISLDVIFQFITGKNIIGLKSAAQNRSSFFGDEYVAGGYIQRFSVMGFFCTLIILKKKYLKILISTTFLILCFFATLYSGNKMPAVILLTFMFITLFFFFLNFGIYKNRAFIFSSLAVLAIVFFQSEKLYSLYLNKIKNSYYFAHSQALGAIPNSFIGAMPNPKIIYSEVTRDYSELNKYKNKTWFHHTEEFKDKKKYRYLVTRSTYNNLYITSLDLFLEKPLTGRGINSFRETCKERVHLPNRICSTHQHNYHLQILNDTGLIGFLIFFGTIVFVILKCFRKSNLRSNIYFYAILSVILIEFFPLRSTGGFFSTINSAYIFLMMGMLFGLKELDYKSKNY